MAAGYFLTNILELACKNRLFFDRELWFPKTDIESHKVGEIDYIERPSMPGADS